MVSCVRLTAVMSYGATVDCCSSLLVEIANGTIAVVGNTDVAGFVDCVSV